MEAIIGTFVGRWYVTLFGLAFVLLASRHLGWRRTGIYAAIAVAVGVAAENASVHLGIPYTRYAFADELRGEELFIGDVPLMVSLSYTFMSYFAFAAARLIVAGPHRTRSSLPVLEYLTAVLLAVWALWVVDPVSRLGEHFFLGELFRYEGPGFWFGLPLGSQLGFAATSAVLVGVLAWLQRDEVPAPVARLRDHPRLGALVGYLGQVAFMTVTAFVVARTTDEPDVARVADTIAGSALLIAMPMALLVAVHWRAQADAWSRSGPQHREVPDLGVEERAAGRSGADPVRVSGAAR